MGLSQFFIERPVFAWVIAIVIVMFGIIAINTLPVTQYPTIAPPSLKTRSGSSKRIISWCWIKSIWSVFNRVRDSSI